MDYWVTCLGLRTDTWKFLSSIRSPENLFSQALVFWWETEQLRDTAGHPSPVLLRKIRNDITQEHKNTITKYWNIENTVGY